MENRRVVLTNINKQIVLQPKYLLTKIKIDLDYLLIIEVYYFFSLKFLLIKNTNIFEVSILFVKVKTKPTNKKIINSFADIIS